MNIDLLLEKLIHVARSNPPSDRVPYTFEKRILERIWPETVMDTLTLWVRALWRATIPCVGLMLFLGVWATHSPEQHAKTDAADLEAELETTLMAAVSINDDLPW